MSFKDAKKLAAANSANTTLMTAELAAVTIDDDYTLCTDGRYITNIAMIIFHQWTI